MNKLCNHFAKYYPLYLWILVGCTAFGRGYAVSLNVTNSLPGIFYLIEKNKAFKPAPNEMIAFLYEGDAFYSKGAVFVKIVKGIPGSIVSSKEADPVTHDYFVDNVFFGRAKPYSSTGVPIKRGPTGIIPEDHYYVYATHPDSLDSRYELVGWVRRNQIIGRAIRVF
ncbi:S26 family signal peptidase [Nitrosomonas mobilis]|jgi:conjugal transfer pilin signal peptidase TrbI|uniref:Peptidase S26 domain-containing protein n=1 Tax=Nitrosomonas mobilis TaxID=51642 RepID=A0A1G5SCQ9_9PROT|nr:S26 family signal peptidase [Nitrosomonas mobilis]SCZ84984.1 conserved hypothetical protein [Nitrosomonas mobilis]